MKVEVTINGQTVELTTKEEIEKACVEEHHKKYLQTNNTPPMQPPLKELLGQYANTPFCEEILMGTAEFLPELDEYTIKFLQQLRKPDSVTLNSVPTVIPSAEWAKGWNKMKETTLAAGFTGLHFGHLKACSTDKFLTDFEASISQIAYSSGAVPSAWTNSVICMIKKKAQVDHIESLRSIVLTEADCNFNNKILGKSAMQVAEENQLLAPEQYGSRKGKLSIDHALHKRLSYDIVRQSRTAGALCSNDAKSCFDRIVHTIAILAYRRLGIANPPVESMIRSIQEMKHHFRTSHGDSEICLEQPIRVPCYQGILQGNGAAPTTWVLISTPLLNMLREARKGGLFTSPVSKNRSHFVGYAYVDDMDIITTNNHNINLSVDEVMEEMQLAIDIWEGGLSASGGAIVPEKSWVYPINFSFDNKGQWHYQSAEEIGAEFTV